MQPWEAERQVRSAANSNRRVSLGCEASPEALAALVVDLLDRVDALEQRIAQLATAAQQGQK